MSVNPPLQGDRKSGDDHPQFAGGDTALERLSDSVEIVVPTEDGRSGNGMQVSWPVI